MLIFAALVAMAEPARSMDAPPLRPEITQAPVRSPPSPAPLRRVSEVPGVTIIYYDVVGTDVPRLHLWLETHGPRDPQTHKVTPATSNWEIGSAVKFKKTGGQCTLTGATVKFTATVTLPRLAAGQRLPAPVLQRWNAYVAALEDRQAVQLGFVHDRLGEVERAIMRSNCTSWQKAAGAAIDRLGQDQAQAFKPDPKAQPKLLEPDKGA